MGDLKYKVGDKVRVKSLDWYNNNKDEYGDVDCSPYTFLAIMCHCCGKIYTINSVDNFAKKYTMTEDGGHFDWTDEMIEGIAENENNHLTETVVDIVKESNDRYRIVIDHRFDIEVDEGEYYAVRRRKEHPKTYEECLKVLGYADRETYCVYCVCHTGANERLFESMYRLKVCRDAYWKIAGEEMGLGKPWEPDWSTEYETKYVIEVYRNNVRTNSQGYSNTILSFPTAEMRNDFFNAFRDDIEKCKELL